jgi:hypothetical protein
VTVPANTPASDAISIQFNPFTWFEPIPMWKEADGTWTYVLNGPLDFGGALAYRFCRNLQCGSADDIDTAGPSSSGRTVMPSAEPQTITDTVRVAVAPEETLRDRGRRTVHRRRARVRRRLRTRAGLQAFVVDLDADCAGRDGRPRRQRRDLHADLDSPGQSPAPDPRARPDAGAVRRRLA